MSQDADKGIVKVLKEKGRLVHQSTITHSYPFCWRSDSHTPIPHTTSFFTKYIRVYFDISFLSNRSETPLIYRAVPSWFIRVEMIVQQLLENNNKCYWSVQKSYDG